jgi:hypothetical protein
MLRIVTTVGIRAMNVALAMAGDAGIERLQLADHPMEFANVPVGRTRGFGASSATLRMVRAIVASWSRSHRRRWTPPKPPSRKRPMTRTRRRGGVLFIDPAPEDKATRPGTIPLDLPRWCRPAPARATSLQPGSRSASVARFCPAGSGSPQTFPPGPQQRTLQTANESIRGTNGVFRRVSWEIGARATPPAHQWPRVEPMGR